MMTKKWSWLVFVILLLGLVVPILAQAEPAISTDQSVYPPGATVTVYGQGFKPGSVVDIGVFKPGDVEDKEQVETTEKGTFTYYYKNTDKLGEYGVA
ncbi:hypothetical protein J7J63_09280, partial [Candidatus Bipolaricaulota bacterium]|nr:hypothetical protein [Candidatus Bipolaricaulota bacterium]